MRKSKLEYVILTILKVLLLIAITLFPNYNDILKNVHSILEYIVLIILLSIYSLVIIQEFIRGFQYIWVVIFNAFLGTLVWEGIKYIEYQLDLLPYYFDVPVLFLIVLELTILFTFFNIIWFLCKAVKRIKYKKESRL